MSGSSWCDSQGQRAQTTEQSSFKVWNILDFNSSGVGSGRTQRSTVYYPVSCSHWQQNSRRSYILCIRGPDARDFTVLQLCIVDSCPGNTPWSCRWHYCRVRTKERCHQGHSPGIHTTWFSVGEFHTYVMPFDKLHHPSSPLSNSFPILLVPFFP